jgi:hypothetical protein
VPIVVDTKGSEGVTGGNGGASDTFANEMFGSFG